MVEKLSEVLASISVKSKINSIYLLNTTYLTAPNIAAKVSNVVIAIVTRPGMDCGGKNKESHATITKRPLGK